MREINREQAESFINNSDVVTTNVDYERDNLVVHFFLANKQTLHVHYNMQRSLKTYFINGDIHPQEINQSN
jgi:hypothetical protein